MHTWEAAGDSSNTQVSVTPDWVWVPDFSLTHLWLLKVSEEWASRQKSSLDLSGFQATKNWLIKFLKTDKQITKVNMWNFKLKMNQF